MTSETNPGTVEACPFCDAAMSHCSDKDGEFWMHPGTVTDGDCFMSGQGIFLRQLTAWNTRAAQSQPAATVQEAIDFKYWLMDAARILRSNGTDTHASWVEKALAALSPSKAVEPAPEQGTAAIGAEAGIYAAELREIAGMLAQQPDGPVRWKQYRLAAIADYLSSLSQPVAAPQADDTTLRRAQIIVDIANRAQGASVLDTRPVPVDVLRAAAMAINALAFQQLGPDFFIAAPQAATETPQ